MSDAILGDLPEDLPGFLARFGTDEQCRAHLVGMRWPQGFHCAGCGHGAAWSHRKRLIEECRSCGRQHSILAGTIFEQTKTNLARWFLAIYLVTASKGGIAASELQRQLGFRSYETAPPRPAGRVPFGNRINGLLTIDGAGCTRSAGR
jgi:hypothetical protein